MKLKDYKSNQLISGLPNCPCLKILSMKLPKQELLSSYIPYQHHISPPGLSSWLHTAAVFPEVILCRWFSNRHTPWSIADENWARRSTTNACCRWDKKFVSTKVASLDFVQLEPRPLTGCMTLALNIVDGAAFPGPAQLSVACMQGGFTKFTRTVPNSMWWHHNL